MGAVELCVTHVEDLDAAEIVQVPLRQLVLFLPPGCVSSFLPAEYKGWYSSTKPNELATS